MSLHLSLSKLNVLIHVKRLEQCPAHSAILEGNSLLSLLSLHLPTYIHMPRDGEMLSYNDMLLLSARIYRDSVLKSLVHCCCCCCFSCNP